VKLSSLPIRTLLATTIVLIGMTNICFAQTQRGNGWGGGWPWWPEPTPTPVHRAPEIDPASATTALALLAGSLLVIRGRRR
jgi:hypothetical protein